MNTETGRQATNGPQQWALTLFILFGGAQLIAGVIFFFAYNWRALPDMTKIALPQAAMGAAFILWVILGKGSRLGAVAGLVATVMIGVSMGVVGQVYQLGADPWRLFAIWAALVFPIAVITRSDPQFMLAGIVASIAYFLYTDENIKPFLPQARSIILAAYALILFAIAIGRDMLAGGAPNWMRWLFISAALGAGVIGSLGDIFSDRFPFGDSFTASLALIAVCGGALAAYRYWRPDRPAQALSLFAVAVFAGALGLRIIFIRDIDGAYGISGAMFISALWVVAVTAALAAALRQLNKGAGA
ncbi:DUF2157 domain-containing protein [Hyphococcus flavus]|uniref:DUF2157 domain-containing protein n=1 Tax=Hyphococcus flavus TaxID=1866326 RepID=A0AAF0CGQ7_9PROT|nr:DUF2157 domain-containing protein [Hyphococcus flavus]WDI32744.1 DUF2157 domain-containing protein [Hyphococcus flavus]